MAEEKRLMCVHAHPDDESSKGAATMAKYAQTGRVRVVTMTGGERGSVLNPHFDRSILSRKTMAELRREEMAQAARALGIEQVFLGFVDSGLPAGYPHGDVELPEGCFANANEREVLRALVAQIRAFRPHVLTTYDENGGYPHPDHERTHEASVKAVRVAASQTWPDLGEPWAVQKVYYDVSFSAERIRRIHNAMLAAGMESPFAERLAALSQRQPLHEPTTRINVAAYFPQRDAALRAHASQIDPEGFFFAAPRDIEARVWPYEEFYLAFSRVGQPAEGSIETDLFARIPGLAAE
ncbi:mycothiol S-conjugate amidase [Actinobaculum suis]|uniref:Mycothiol S-conjugate amidase n=1 Tax=Actinobaculum suis TaxID=1657 RepID=A0A0K9EUI1_9ACTO|nr:mycothiol conjugate amidase Mca [Actinobaculum suis]KMY23869.1 GlcNAc-PI de-N-acetylase [Actinobaculum suis]MDY5153585.1 mycothiol conjugate amidase Mca [Actinobaculum suis]OCA93090.1 mycothiol conjugate amidase Mca [Actinobaculum suis]OCA93521.1 mycothiol conjugate amidase Mca [Actinobaculum suis]SDE24540.1 mycothiol S-conjugate amidase [Actinobaculum suis]